MNFLYKPAAVLSGLTLAGALLVAPLQAQTPEPSRFPFVLPWDDATKGTVTDLSALNAKPAGINGRIIIKNGHFVESATGKRIRFFGMNFSGKNNFPTHAEADKIAAHLAKLGFNVLRIHHADGNNSPLWDKKVAGRHTFDADAVDRLDYLIAAMKKQGIYSNVNLHVSRTFAPEDGFPESVKRLPGAFNKRVDNYDRRMIALQKKFARELLTHINPYTGFDYANDPAVAFVEINNENSLAYWASEEGRFDYFENLPEPFRSDLISLWNQWLFQKYGTDQALKAAWGGAQAPALSPTPIDKVSPPALNAAWVLQNVEQTAKILDENPEGAKRDGAKQPSLSSFAVKNDQPTKQPWHVQAQILPLNLVEGQAYTVTFRGRADKNRNIPVYASIIDGDWRNVGLQANVSLTSEWKEFRYFFKAENVQANNNRLAFVLGKEAGTVWINDVKIEPVKEVPFLPEGVSLLGRNIGIPIPSMPMARTDWVRFLIETERNYTDEMLTYLRRDLKVQAPLLNSQMQYGELASFYREANSDFADEHAYWQHPEFPTEKWDGRNFTMQSQSMVSALAKGENNTFERLALHRVVGKPYTVSEYCVSAPNLYQAEMYPLLASYAALQDWDAIYHFDYGDYGEAVPSDRIQNFFSLNGNPLKGNFVPAAALLFRNGGITPLSNVSTLELSDTSKMAGKGITREWTLANSDRKVDLLNSRLQVQPDSITAQSRVNSVQGTSPAQSLARVISLKSGEVYVSHGPGAVAMAGFVGSETLTTPDATFTFPAFGNNYAALILTSANGKSLPDSERLLLTVGGQAANTGTSQDVAGKFVNYVWGTAPTLVEGIPGTIVIRNKKVRRVWALSPTGTRTKEVPVKSGKGSISFVVGPQYQTINYELSE